MNKIEKIFWQTFYKDVEYEKAPDREIGGWIFLAIAVSVLVFLIILPR